MRSSELCNEHLTKQLGTDVPWREGVQAVQALSEMPNNRIS